MMPCSALLLLLLLLRTTNVCSGLPQGRSGDGDVAAADAAAAAQAPAALPEAIPRTASGRKRHVTRPHPRAPPGGDPAAAFKVIRRRKVLSPRGRQPPSDASVSGDDVTGATERSFREFLRPPFLALLNDSHFSLQPEFVLAQAGEHRMEPFRGFGEKLEQTGLEVPPVEGVVTRVNASDVGGDGEKGESEVPKAGADHSGEASERHGKVVVRRKKVRVLRPGETDETRDSEKDREVVQKPETPSNVTKSARDGDAKGSVSLVEEDSAAKGASGLPETSTETPESTTRRTPPSAALSSTETPGSTSTTSETASSRKVPSAAPVRRRPGRLLVSVSKSKQASSLEKSETNSTTELDAKTPGSSDIRKEEKAGPGSVPSTPSRRPSPRAGPRPLRRRPPSLPSSSDDPSPKLSKSEEDGGPLHAPLVVVTSPPARRRLSVAAQRRRARFRERHSRQRSNATTVGVSTTEASPVNREKKEVAKVLGLLGRIRNRARVLPSFLPTRESVKDNSTSITTSTPSTTQATTSTTTEKATTTSANTEVTSPPPKAPTTSKATTATSTPVPTIETTPRPPVVVKSSTTPSPEEVPGNRAVTIAPKRVEISSPLPPASGVVVISPVGRRQRPDALLRAVPQNGNLLARRLQERRNIFALRGGPKSDPRSQLPTITPFPLLLSTIKTALKNGPPLDRNITIAVSFPRGGIPTKRPALPPARTSVPLIQSTVSPTKTTVLPSRSPVATQVPDSVLAIPVVEAALNVRGNDDRKTDAKNTSSTNSSTAVPRKVLGTSMETSVSVDVSPLEFKLRKRVKLPSEIGDQNSNESPKQPSPDVTIASVLQPTAPLFGVAPRRRQPVIESSVVETTSRPDVPRSRRPSPSLDRDEQVITAVLRSGVSRQNGISGKAKQRNGNPAAEGHSYVDAHPVGPDSNGAKESYTTAQSSTDHKTNESPRRPTDKDPLAQFTDMDVDLEAEDEDLLPAPSTTIATYVKPSNDTVYRISSDDSFLAPSGPIGVPHQSSSASDSSTPFSSGLPSSPVSSSRPSPPTSSTPAPHSSSPRPASSTPRQARVEDALTPLEEVPAVLVPVVAEPVVPEPEETASSGGPIYLVSLLFVLPVVAVAVWYLKKNHPDVRTLMPERLKSMLMTQETPDNAHENFYPVEVEENAGKKASTSHVHDTLARRRRWEHPRETLRLQSVLGEGHFGQVWRAEVDNIRGHQGTLLVAVKSAKENAASKEQQDLLRELRIMQDLGSHPNVVTLLGCCTTQEPVLVILEYMVFGKLLTYLRENRGRHNYYNFSHDSAVLTSPDLTLFACQIAAGMEYIANKGIVHRDLAARNILVDHAKVCKVSDFGMSRSVKEISAEAFEQKHRGALPIRWMSPESLYHNTFNQQTDCWSFGILLWEIITLGSTPYPGLSAREVMRSVREGYRLERPEHCHPQLYQLAASCWAAEPGWRPTFAELRNDLEVLLEDQNQGYVDLDRFQEEIYSTLNKSSDEKV